jgi:hypothetical protein
LARCPECRAGSYASCITVSEAPLRGQWPETEVYSCEWHLQHALERLFRNERHRNPQRAEATDALTPGIERAFDGRHFWRPFVREVRAADIEALDL